MFLPKDIQKKIVAVVLEKIELKNIYIFGSYARGDAKQDSDIDIYIVTPDVSDDSDILRHLKCELRVDLLNAIPDYSKDIICSCQSNFMKQLQRYNSIESSVIREGVKIYG